MCFTRFKAKTRKAETDAQGGWARCRASPRRPPSKRLLREFKDRHEREREGSLLRLIFRMRIVQPPQWQPNARPWSMTTRMPSVHRRHVPQRVNPLVTNTPPGVASSLDRRMPRNRKKITPSALTRTRKPSTEFHTLPRARIKYPYPTHVNVEMHQLRSTPMVPETFLVSSVRTTAYSEQNQTV